MTDWLAKFVDMTNGVPCVKTFKRVFARLEPEGIERIHRTLTDLIKEKK